MVVSGRKRDSPRAITARLTLNEAVERWPEVLSVMGRYGMQRGCCGGLTLAALAERNNLDVNTMLAEIRRATPRSAWTSEPAEGA